MSLVIVEGKYGAIDTDNYSWHGYYIIKFSLSTYTLQSDLSIDRQVISSGEILCEETYCFLVSIDFHCYVSQKTKYINTILSLRAILNDNGNVICYDSKDVVTQVFKVYIIK